jgi:murein DD-endopeptidase MepM/ murein hydrolase activator NlpD
VFSDKTVDYFDDQGRSVRRALLRTPVAAARVTSGFGMRMHPLLGYSKMHKGVDFGAPTGTPIFAAGSGTIEDIGFKNGYGRYIKIKHNGTMATAYAHMSRFNTHLYRGSKVNQGEVIGYVGMSGRATGPHLHFEVHLNGQQVNPMSVNLPAGRVLEGKLLAEFKDGQDHIRKEFSDLIAANQNTPVPTAQQQMPNPALIKAATMVAVTPAQSRGL